MAENIDMGIWASQVGRNPPGGFVGTVIASAATIAPNKPIHHVSGTGTITNITLPFTGFVGKICLIADAAWVLNTGGTAGSAIGTVVTAVAAQAIELTFDGSVWYPHIMD